MPTVSRGSASAQASKVVKASVSSASPSTMVCTRPTLSTPGAPCTALRTLASSAGVVKT